VRTKEQIEASGAYEKTDYTPAFNDSKNIVTENTE
jgi:hypothetical protein